MSSKGTLIGIIIVAGVIAASYHYVKRATHRPAPTEVSGASPATGARVAESSDLQTLIATLQAENARLRNAMREQGAVGMTESAMRVRDLREVFARMPEQSIPELRLATDADWFGAVEGPLDTVEDFRRAMARLRGSAEKRFAALVHDALETYLSANADFPTDVLQLAPYVAGTVGSDMLSRYEIISSNRYRGIMTAGDRVISQRNLVDASYDCRSYIGSDGFGSTSDTGGP